MSSVRVILQATTTLSQIQGADREALLLTHRKELESAFHNLQELLQPAATPVTLSATFNGIPTTSAAYASPDASGAPQETFGSRDTLSVPAECIASDASRIARAGDTRKEDDDNILPNQVKTLIERLKKCEHQILTYPYQPAQSAVLPETDWVFEDPCIVDISFLDRSKSPDTKFRSGLSALFLGDEYTEWERSYGTTRVDTLFGDLNLASSRKDAAYKEYVDSCADRFKHKEKARKYIEYGVKFRVFEKIYLARVEVSMHAGIKAGTHVGVLGILFFAFNEFRRLKYGHLPVLANAILASQWRGHAETLRQLVSLCFENHKSRILEISQIAQLGKNVLASDGTEQRKRRRLEGSRWPNQGTSQNIPPAQFSDLVPREHAQDTSLPNPLVLQDTAEHPQNTLPDLIPLEHAKTISSEDPFVLHDTTTVHGHSQNTLPVLIPLEHSQAMSSENSYFPQNTPIPDLYPIELGLPQDIETEVRSFVSNLDPKNYVSMAPLPLNPSNTSVYNPL